MSTSSLDDQAAQLNEVWEVEAKGRAKILEANDRRRKRLREAQLLAQSEIDRFKEVKMILNLFQVSNVLDMQEKEAAFRLKCQSFENEDKRRKRALIRDVERELDYMEARVQLCKSTVSHSNDDLHIVSYCDKARKGDVREHCEAFVIFEIRIRVDISAKK
ncbi:unnamed protein product [Cylicostephanus goldi]|uniref:Uncharacterized protein n=1 Tax=Cylicostephanus goldi TaxID=71465 RepID=A0A3P7PSB2_CYLGO|nr:unnamed protein product [Cylicostephanus goldi]